MEAKDVKVGMRVIPFCKSVGFKPGSFSEFTAGWRDDCCIKHLLNNGFLNVKEVMSDGNVALACSDEPGALMFNASDFSPATIEVGDTVRLIYVGKERVVSSIRDDKYYMLYDDGKGGMTEGQCGFFAEGIDLVRKAKRVPNSEIPKPADTRYRPKKGERVKMLRGKNHSDYNGVVGTCEDEPRNGEYGCGIRFDDGHYRACAECEPAHADRRPTVGDWVEVVANAHWGHPVGTIGKVVAVSPSAVQFSANGHILWSTYDEVKLTTPPEQKPREFKVGDRVTVKNQYNYSVGGRTGTIVAKHGTREWSVDFGCSFDGHDCGCMKTNTGWWVPEFLLDHATEPATVLKSDADAAVRRAFDAGFIDGQKAMKSRVSATEIVPNPSKAALAKFWEAE